MLINDSRLFNEEVKHHEMCNFVSTIIAIIKLNVRFVVI